MTNETDQLHIIWERVARILENEMVKSVFDTWIKGNILLSITDTKFEIGTPDRTIKKWLEVRYVDVIKKAVQAATNKELEIVFTCVNINTERELQLLGAFQSLSNDQKERALHYIETSNNNTEVGFSPNFPATSSLPNKEYTFDRLVVGSHNQMAYQVANDIVINVDNQLKLVYFYGDVGLGKTHLVQAIFNNIRGNKPFIKIKYIAMDDFIDQIINAIAHSRVKDYREDILSYDIVIFDQFEALANKVHSQEEFSRLLNNLFANKKQVVIACTKSPGKMIINGMPFTGLFEIGASCSIMKPEFDAKIAIINQTADSLKTKLPDHIMSVLATKVHNNIRELINDINKIALYVKMNGQLPDQKSLNMILDDESVILI